MGAFGPYTAVAGQLQTAQLGPLDSRSLVVQNRSRFDLGISLANHVPPVVTQFGGEWDAVCPAGDRLALDIDELNYLRGAWMGNAYILPIDPSPHLALSGVISQSPVYYLRTSPLAARNGGYSASAGTDVTNQPRVISIPIAMTHFFQGTFTGTTGLHTTYNLTSEQQAQHTCTFYLYYYYAVLLTSGTTFFSSQNQVYLQFYSQPNAGGIALGTPFVFLEYFIVTASPSPVQSFTFNPATPFVFQFSGSVPAGAQSVAIVTHQVIGTNGNTTTVTLAANLDLTNTVPVADIGTAALYDSSQASF